MSADISEQMKSVKNCKHPTIICTAQNFDTKKCFARKNCMKMKLRRLRLVIFVIHSDYFSFHQKMGKKLSDKRSFFACFFFCSFFVACFLPTVEKLIKNHFFPIPNNKIEKRTLFFKKFFKKIIEVVLENCVIFLRLSIEMKFLKKYPAVKLYFLFYIFVFAK